jgi:hypothetical protein
MFVRLNEFSVRKADGSQRRKCSQHLILRFIGYAEEHKFTLGTGGTHVSREPQQAE